MALASVYVEHGEALEADLLHFYNQDVNKVSLRRMRNLFFRLPYNSDVHFEINETPAEARIWTPDTYMLANLIDIMNAVDWHIIAANSKNPPRPPKPFKRPETTKTSKLEKPKGYWPGKTIIDKG
jgi:hypothetical protein